MPNEPQLILLRVNHVISQEKWLVGGIQNWFK